MRIISWNVNSILARLDRVSDFLKRDQSDIVALQELKCIDANFPTTTIQELGYHALVFGQKTYNGVAILAKQPLELVRKGFGDPAYDNEARFLHAVCADLHIICVYVPNGQEVGAERYIYKLQWLKRLETYLADLTPDVRNRVVLLGDFNVARTAEDVYDHALLDGSLLYSQPERDALEGVLRQNLSDSFRLHTPTGKHYSWWDYRGLAFPFGKGLRIDYVLLGSALVPRCRAAWIERNERKGIKPSDHAPVGVELEL